MGTNYFLHEQVCECCGCGRDVLHIGKSSGGWCFSLHVMPDKGLNSLPDWVDRWSRPNARIVDEYGKQMSLNDMLLVITARFRDSLPDIDFVRNEAMPGPNNLIRHQIGRHCVAHGDGTWDLIPGEFS